MERLVLAGSLLFWGGVSALAPPPALQCPLLDERGTVTPRPALLRIWGGPETPPDPQKTPSRDPEGTFHVTDPWNTLRDFWGPPWEPPRCELSPTTPLLPLPPAGTPPQKCPSGGGGSWWLLALGTPGREGTALLQGGGHPPRANVSLTLFTLTPTLQGVLGTPQTLHCAVSPPPDGPFSVEWLHHRGGVTKRLLSFASPRGDPHGDPRDPPSSPEAAPGVLLLLGGSRASRPMGGAEEQEPAGGALEVSLQLPPLRPSDSGSFVCSVTTPRGHAQQVLRLRVIAPPRVSVVPSPLVLFPGVPAELRCDAVGFFPLDVGIRWERRPGGGSRRALPVPPGDTWSSGHRRAADGTFGRSAGLRVTGAEHGDSFDCVVTHPAWGEPRRVTVTVEGAGATGPSLEDVAGVALVAFVLGGLCLRLWPPQGG